jgi:acyl-CoA synthetase (AMP-forming)/AMP-acid ligase II
MPDDLLGQKLVLVMEKESEINTEKILQKLSSEIDKKSIPKMVFLLPELPRNKSFKIDRIMLKELISGMGHYDS